MFNIKIDIQLPSGMNLLQTAAATQAQPQAQAITLNNGIQGIQGLPGAFLVNFLLINP